MRYFELFSIYVRLEDFVDDHRDNIGIVIKRFQNYLDFFNQENYIYSFI